MLVTQYLDAPLLMAAGLVGLLVLWIRVSRRMEPASLVATPVLSRPLSPPASALHSVPRLRALAKPHARLDSNHLVWFEIVAIVAWAIWVGRGYLDFDAALMPQGTWNEFGMAIQPHSIWTQLTTCGPCVFWNGAVNGGYPAFVDLHGAQLHPLVILTTLIWGTTIGAKVAIVASLAIAGIGQWWLARVLQLGLLARMWNAALVVQENSWTGWHAYRNGQSVALKAEHWLSVAAQPGTHQYTFRYRPWDVPAGAALSGFGLLLALWLWRHGYQQVVQEQSVVQ